MSDVDSVIKESNCRECGKHFFFASDAQSHRCLPQWHVWEDDGEGREWATVVRAHDAQAAAEQWAEQEDQNSADYDIVSQREIPTVRVAPVDGEGGVADIRYFVVSGQSVPEYTAREVTANLQENNR